MSDRLQPPIPRELLEWLEGIFPDRTPAITDTDREVWAKVGEQRVLTKLRHEYASQTKEDLPDVL